MNQTTLPYEEVAGATYPARDCSPQGVTVQLPYEQAKPFLSNRPLRRPSRSRLTSLSPDAQAKHHSPAAALEPWEISEEGVQVMQQVLDPNSTVGKSSSAARAAPRADASIIRRRQS